MPTNRYSFVFGVEFQIPADFDFSNEGDLTAVRGGNVVCRTVEWDQGLPEIDDFVIGDIDINYFADEDFSDLIAIGTIQIGTDALYYIGDESIVDIITVTNFVDEGDTTGSVDIEVDPSGITATELTETRNVYIQLTVAQPSDLTGTTVGQESSDAIHVEISHITGDAPVIASETLSWTGSVGTSFSRTVFATSETDITWSLESGGTLPPGLGLNASTGVVSGTPTEAGETTTVIVATNDHGTDTVSITFQISIFFDWTNEGALSVTGGGASVSRTIEWAQGTPVISGFGISAISLLFYQEAVGTNRINSGDTNYTIGDQTLADIITLGNFVDNGDGTGSVDLQVDPSGIEPSELDAMRNVYVVLEVDQP